MKHLAITLILALSAAGASAAKFESLEKAEALAFQQERMESFCEAIGDTQLDCWTAAFKITSKRPSERWNRTVQQIVYAMGAPYVEDVWAKVLDAQDDAPAILSHYDEVILSAGWDRSYADQASEDQHKAEGELFEALSNDVDDARLVFVAASESGAFSSSHLILALIDEEADEVLLFSAGYSE
jgi:hypothetical protein